MGHRAEALDREVRSDLLRISADTITYNTEIAANTTDFALLRKNVADEQGLVKAWDSELTQSSFATDNFEKNTSSLIYRDNPRGKQEVALMAIYMKIYTISMGNAQQHLIDYTNNAGLYVATDDPDYWNDGYLQSAMMPGSLPHHPWRMGIKPLKISPLRHSCCSNPGEFLFS